MKRVDARESRGFVLVAVVIVVAAAILVATGALFTARAATAGARAGESERALRAAALDGVATAAESLASQRREILAGATPLLGAAVLSVVDGDATIEVRAMPLGNGETLESENAKIDIHAATPAALASLVAEDSREAQELVERIASARPLASVDGAASLVGAASRGPALRALLGPLRTLGESEPSRAGDESSEPRPLVSLVTVHAREALVRGDGARRLDLVAAFDDGAGTGGASASLAEFEDAERETLARLVESLEKSGDSDGPVDDGAVARALLARGVVAERIDAVLDRVTLAPGDIAPARLDIVRADARAIAALPGMNREIADRIVDLRDSLDERERLGVSWLFSRRVVDADRFGRIAGSVTHRSTMWRFRIEARRAAPDRDEDGPAASEAVAAFDCIVDVADESPRIVSLRDVSMLPAARLLLASRLASDASVDATDPDSEDAGETRGAARAGSVAGAFDERLADGPGDVPDEAPAEGGGEGRSEAPNEPPFARGGEVRVETESRPLDERARPATIDRPVRRAGASRTGRDVAPSSRE